MKYTYWKYVFLPVRILVVLNIAFGIFAVPSSVLEFLQSSWNNSSQRSRKLCRAQAFWQVANLFFDMNVTEYGINWHTLVKYTYLTLFGDCLQYLRINNFAKFIPTSWSLCFVSFRVVLLPQCKLWKVIMDLNSVFDSQPVKFYTSHVLLSKHDSSRDTSYMDNRLSLTLWFSVVTQHISHGHTIPLV